MRLIEVIPSIPSHKETQNILTASIAHTYLSRLSMLNVCDHQVILSDFFSLKLLIEKCHKVLLTLGFWLGSGKK